MISGSWEDRENEEEICERVKEKRMASKEDNWEGYIGGGENEKEEMG